jgi:hypothetical protein
MDPLIEGYLSYLEEYVAMSMRTFSGLTTEENR